MITTIKEWLTPEKLVSIERIPKSYDLLIITTKRKYRGWCTVFHDADTGQRMGTLTESWLSDIVTKWRWEN